jgi:hypothetical protein
MSDEARYTQVREPIRHPVPLSALAEVWAALGAPPVVDIPGPGLLANIARANLPILIGRTLIRAEKVGGKWHVSRDDLRDAARDLVALVAPLATPLTAPLSTAPASAPAEDVVTIRTTDPEWTGKLARMLRDTRQDEPTWTGPTWKRSWYWGCQWGCLDLAGIAVGSGETWTVPQRYFEFLAVGAALVEAVTVERRRCSRCGAAVARRVGWAEVDSAAGWENLCVTCLAAHHSRLRDYDGQLRDILYVRARYRRENPAPLYRCVLCGDPAVVWDHCHEHGYIRGPLCRRCNTNDYWLFRAPYRLDRRPIDHVQQCKGCAGTRPGLGINAAVIQRWIATIIRAPEGHSHPLKVELTAFPGKLGIQDAIRQQTYAVESVAWTCRECEEHWEQPIDPDQMIAVSSQVTAYLRTGDISLITEYSPSVEIPAS